MVVQSSEGVGNKQAVMPRVEVAIQEPAFVKQAMKEVLPGIHDEAGEGELQDLDPDARKRGGVTAPLFQGERQAGQQDLQHLLEDDHHHNLNGRDQVLLLYLPLAVQAGRLEQLRLKLL